MYAIFVGKDLKFLRYSTIWYKIYTQFILSRVNQSVPNRAVSTNFLQELIIDL